MSFEYALIDASDYKIINKKECMKIFDIKDENKKYLFFIVNKNDQKILIENLNIESLDSYKKYLNEVNDKNNKNIKKKVPDKFTQEIFEIGYGEFEKNFKISNSINRDVENQEKFKPEKLDDKLKDYQDSVNKILKKNKEKIKDYINLEFIYNINQITKSSSFAFNQYFEKKLDNELRKIGISLDFKKDFYNENEECSFCNQKSKNNLYDYFDNNYKLCKECEYALSKFYPHNFVTKKINLNKK